MTTLETSLTRLITKDPTILNENANKDSNTFSTMRDLTVERYQSLMHSIIYFQSMLLMHINWEIFIFTT